jgi:hypothetical protein
MDVVAPSFDPYFLLKIRDITQEIHVTVKPLQHLVKAFFKIIVHEYFI